MMVAISSLFSWINLAHSVKSLDRSVAVVPSLHEGRTSWDVSMHFVAALRSMTETFPTTESGSAGLRTSNVGLPRSTSGSNDGFWRIEESEDDLVDKLLTGRPSHREEIIIAALNQIEVLLRTGHRCSYKPKTDILMFMVHGQWWWIYFVFLPDSFIPLLLLCSWCLVAFHVSRFTYLSVWRPSVSFRATTCLCSDDSILASRGKPRMNSCQK